MYCWEMLHTDFIKGETLTSLFSHINHKNINTFVNELCQYNSPLGHKKEIADLIEHFHVKSCTMTPEIEKCICELRNGANIVIMPHQPNMFPSVAIVEPIFYLVEACRLANAKSGKRFLPVFMFVDYDSADDKRFHKCSIPIISRPYRKHLHFSIPSGKSKDTMFNIDKPSFAIVQNWMEDFRVAAKQFAKGSKYSQSLGVYFKQMKAILCQCYDRADTFAEFNEFVLDYIINRCWGMAVLFFKGHMQYLSTSVEFEELIKNQKKINILFNDAIRILRSEQVDISVKTRNITDNKVWHYKVECKRRCKERCDQCSNMTTFKTSKQYLLPDVIFDNILDYLYLGKSGAVGYYRQAEHIVISNYIQSALYGECLCPQLLIKSDGIDINSIYSNVEFKFPSEYTCIFNDRQNSIFFLCCCIGIENLKKVLKDKVSRK